MKMHTRHTLRWSLLICCILILTLLIGACSTSGSGGTTTTIPTPTPTPTPAVNSYTGQGYTINYPKDWTSKKDSHQVSGHAFPTTTFTDSLGINTITIGVLPDPNGTIPAQTVVATAVEVA